MRGPRLPTDYGPVQWTPSKDGITQIPDFYVKSNSSSAAAAVINKQKMQLQAAGGRLRLVGFWAFLIFHNVAQRNSFGFLYTYSFHPVVLVVTQVSPLGASNRFIFFFWILGYVARL